MDAGLRVTHWTPSAAGLTLLALFAACSSPERGEGGDPLAEKTEKQASTSQENGSDPAGKGAEAKPGDTAARKKPPLVDARLGLRFVAKTRANGLRCLAIPAPAGELARIELAIEAGSLRDPASQPGIALLTAHCLRESGAGGEPGKSLEQSLRELSASIEVRVEDRFARFIGTCPPTALPKLAELLRAVISQDFPSETVVRREAARLRAELARHNREEERRWVLRKVSGIDVAAPQQIARGIERVRPAAVTLFYSSYYRPQSATLLVQSPLLKSQEEAGVLLDRLGERFDTWSKGRRVPPLRAPKRVEALSFLRDRDGPVLIEAVLPSPAPEYLETGLGEVAWQLLTLGGYGGVLRAKLEAEGIRGAVSTSEDLPVGSGGIRVLRVEVPANRVAAGIRAVRAAFAELAGHEVERRLLRLAKRRARFEWDRRVAEPALRSALFREALLRGQGGDFDQRTQSEFRDAEPDAVRMLAQKVFRPALLVRGPRSAAPASAVPIEVPEEVSASDKIEMKLHPLELSPLERGRMLARILAKARSAIGGAEEIAETAELSFDVRCLYAGAIPFDEEWRMKLPKGPFERTRRILGVKIRSIWQGDNVVEDGPDAKRKLAAEEAAQFRLDTWLHPALVLREDFLTKGRKDTQLRLSGSLQVRGRKLWVIEDEASAAKLRLLVDAENGLLRRVQYREWQPDAHPIEVALVFREYQAAGKLRLPRTAFKFVEGEYRAELRYSYESK